MNVSEEKKANIDKLFDEYRKSGLGLMTTIIGLSSGAFIGLFKNEDTRKISFLYFIPIAIALLQQLTHYLGNQKKAISGYHWLTSSHTRNAGEGMDAYIDAKTNLEQANLLYGISDKFCLFSCFSMGLVTIYPMILFTSATVVKIIITILTFCLTYWFVKWFKLNRKLKRTDWFNNE